MITRRIGKLLRGKATPFQVFSAGVLGALIAFAPGFSQGPGLMLFWFFLLAVLNANLFVAAIVGAGSALLALLLTPVSFAVGRFLLEGPTEGLFKGLSNHKINALGGDEGSAIFKGVYVITAVFPANETLGMREESQNGRTNPVSLRRFDHAPQNRLMSQMNAVEGA